MAAESKIGRIIRWPFDMELPEFGEGEEILLDSTGSLLKNVPTQGRLVLSTRRLLYMPMRLRFLPRWPTWPFGRQVDIRIADIVSVDRVSWLRGVLGGLPTLPAFKLETSDQQVFLFQVPFAGRWRHQIQELLSSTRR